MLPQRSGCGPLKIRLDSRALTDNNSGIVNCRPQQLPTRIALLALGLCGTSLASAGDCLVSVASLDGLEAQAQSPILSLASPEYQVQALEARCDQFGLAELMVEIEPGQSLDLRLQIHHDQAATARLQTAADEIPSWLLLGTETGSSEAYWSLDLKLDASGLTTAGQRLSQTLELSMETASGPLEWQLPIRLLVLEETPLFRNRFEVDPVLGQFSYIAPSDKDFHSR